MKKYIKIMLLSLLTILLILSVVRIYAKYLTSASGETSFSIAKWNILVNNSSIKNSSDISASIVPIFVDNENIATGIIAPTSEGYIDLNLNFKDADVSFEYTITTSVNPESPVKDLVSTGYSIDDGEKTNFTSFNEPITETIKLSDNIESRKIRIYIKWNDDPETQTMSNEEDALSTNSDIPAILNVNVSFTQIAE